MPVKRTGVNDIAVRQSQSLPLRKDARLRNPRLPVTFHVTRVSTSRLSRGLRGLAVGKESEQTPGAPARAARVGQLTRSAETWGPFASWAPVLGDHGRWWW